VDPIRRWKLCRSALGAVVLELTVVACGAPQAQPTAVEIPSTPRKPDGVLLDTPSALPRAEDRAPARGVVSLREPLSLEAVKEVARAYVRAFEREDIDALGQLLTTDATPLFGARAGRQPLLEQFRTRMKNYDYGKLGGAEVARLDRIERYELDELGVPGAPDRPPEMKPGDLLVRVPITTPRVGAEPLFGDVVILLLRRDEGHFKIAGVAEENGP
jgi:hypothetical protein